MLRRHTASLHDRSYGYGRSSSTRPRVRVLEDRLCPSSGYLVVGCWQTNSVLRYDQNTGAFVSQFDPHNLGDLHNPTAGVFGPDGNLYVSSGIFSSKSAALQYNGTTGVFANVFASQNVTSPRGLLFGPDGNLYVADGNDAASGDPASVERFDGKTGAFLNYFVAPGSNGGLEHPTFMVFGPDGANDGKLDLYVAAAHEGAIYRYDGTTGAFKGVFVTAGSGGLDSPQGMVFGPDGNLYVASSNWFTRSNGPFYTGAYPPGAVLRFEGPSGPNPGAFLGTFIAGAYGGLANPTGLLFGPDPSGNGNTDLYVACAALDNFKAENGTSQVLRYDAATGAFLGTFITPDSGSLKFPTFLTFTETDPTTLNYNGAVPSGASEPSGNSTPTTAALVVYLASHPGIDMDAGSMPAAQAIDSAGVGFASARPSRTPMAGPSILLQASREIISWSLAAAAKSQQPQNPFYADVDSFFADPLALGLR